MDFFQSQDTARQNTKRLVFFFALAVVGLIVVTNLLVMLLFGFIEPGEQGLTLNAVVAQFDWRIFLTVSALVLTVILGGSAYKTMALSGGGTAVAESLGGRLIDQSTNDLHERKVLNVVEEMAIASGSPVPPVYLLEGEEGINAFAAGYSPGDAVIGVTRGTIAFLSREELQGVIAHEFSHVLHGDMRLNIRLIGVLHGILLLGLIGYFVLHSSRGNSKNAGPIIGLGIGLIVIGFAGTFFGNLIKASVSRQREFLADASAVQYTRNKNGIAGALKKIGGYAAGSELESPEAPTMSHAFFSNAISSMLGSLSATHPPLEVRIKRIDSTWDGVFEPVTHEVNEQAENNNRSASKKEQQRARAEKMVETITSAVIINEILNSIGQTDATQLNYAATLINDIPATIRQALHEPYAARAVIYCLLIDNNSDIQQKQFQHLKEFADTGIYDLSRQLFKSISQLDIKFRLPLIDIALPILRQLSKKQYQLFKKNLHSLITADGKVDIFEWSLQKILLSNLEKELGDRKNHASKKIARYGSLRGVKKHVEVLISMLVYTCQKNKTQQDTKQIEATFSKAQQELKIKNLTLLPQEQINFDNLELAIDTLALLKPLQKPRLLKACLICMTQDQIYSPQEKELMRAIANTLDCPIPLFVE